jgi:murein DD-endopeptidase MepM/ murein hydrolase activator NlpD
MHKKKIDIMLFSCIEYLMASLIFLTGLSLPLNPTDYIQADKERWKPYYMEVSPRQAVDKWEVPFKTKNRSSFLTIKVISTFGAPRMSYVRGHYHTGIDLIPQKRSGNYTYVFPMAAGVVCSIHLSDPHRTVVIKHKLSNGAILYTSYKHFKEIYVQTGEQVTSGTVLGRLYTRREALALGGNYDHLHIEVRKKFDDYGVASWATLTKPELEQRFDDPLKFMKKNVK